MLIVNPPTASVKTHANPIDPQFCQYRRRAYALEQLANRAPLVCLKKDSP
ncbi:hypothetical protein [Bradyrhizobium sp. NAS96.2]|nr:hypothetical protein [Bradyrhizobium sp. NAS96.2]